MMIRPKSRILYICIAIVLLFAACFSYIIIRQKTNSLSVLFSSKELPRPVYTLGSAERDLLNEEWAAENASISSPTASPTITLEGSTSSDNVDLLVLGVDSRQFQIDSQTDSIMIIRVGKTNKVIKIVSISRDIYLSIPGFTENRINEANVYGGPELVMKTLNQAFGLNIRQYVVFDFKTAEEMIDLVGMVSVDVRDDEKDALNTEIKELNALSPNSAPSPLVQHTGLQDLNGRQAVAYSKLRPNHGRDIIRMARQRAVVLSLLKLIKQMKIDQVLSLATKSMDFIYTNIPLIQIPDTVRDLYDVRKGSVEQMSIPVEGTYRERSIVQMNFIVINFADNKIELNNFLNR